MDRSSEPSVTTNAPTTAPPTTAEVLAVLRRRPRESGLLGGFGPLVVAVVLAIAMGLLVPSIAPEEIMERPSPVTVGQPPARTPESGR